MARPHDKEQFQRQQEARERKLLRTRALSHLWPDALIRNICNSFDTVTDPSLKIPYSLWVCGFDSRPSTSLEILKLLTSSTLLAYC